MLRKKLGKETTKKVEKYDKNIQPNEVTPHKETTLLSARNNEDKIAYLLSVKAKYMKRDAEIIKKITTNITGTRSKTIKYFEGHFLKSLKYDANPFIVYHSGWRKNIRKYVATRFTAYGYI